MFQLSEFHCLGSINDDLSTDLEEIDMSDLSLGCDFMQGSSCENLDLAQTSMLDLSVAIWYFFFGMIMLTACTVWDKAVSPSRA